MSAPVDDPALLAVARRVLSQHGFRMEEATLEGAGDVTWLLAESDYFLLGVTSGQSFDDLIILEGFLASALGTRLQGDGVGPKRWDSYAVLLSSSGTDQRGAPDVVRLQYNTRSLRRLVCLGVPAHEDTIREALATFLPLPDPPPGGLPSAFDELVSQLVINGIPQERAKNVVDSYRASRSIDG